MIIAFLPALTLRVLAENFSPLVQKAQNNRSIELYGGPHGGPKLSPFSPKSKGRGYQWLRHASYWTNLD